MLGKVVVITGATSGIGRIAAERLAAQGARIVIVARDRVRAERTLARLREIAPNVMHRAHIANLLSLAETKHVGDRITAEEPRIDVLVNNAGSIFSARAVTVDGLERTFALNHTGLFRADPPIARAPDCFGTGAHRQYGLGRAPGPIPRFR